MCFLKCSHYANLSVEIMQIDKFDKVVNATKSFNLQGRSVTSQSSFQIGRVCGNKNRDFIIQFEL